jgi:hypothetical protein
MKRKDKEKENIFNKKNADLFLSILGLSITYDFEDNWEQTNITVKLMLNCK